MRESLVRESLDGARRGGGKFERLEREWVEEVALGLWRGKGGWVELEGAGSGRRWERWFVKRLRRTEEVDVVPAG